MLGQRPGRAGHVSKNDPSLKIASTSFAQSLLRKGYLKKTISRTLALQVALNANSKKGPNNFDRGCRPELRQSGLFNTSYVGADFPSFLRKTLAI